MVRTILAAAHAPYGFPWVVEALAVEASEVEASAEAVSVASEEAVSVEEELLVVGSY